MVGALWCVGDGMVMMVVVVVVSLGRARFLMMSGVATPPLGALGERETLVLRFRLNSFLGTAALFLRFIRH